MKPDTDTAAFPQPASRRSSGILDRLGGWRVSSRIAANTGSSPGIAAGCARIRASLGAFLGSSRFIEHTVAIGLRGASAAGKFALSLYMLAYLGLAELGIFGLLIAVATAAPAVLGFGVSDWTTRHVIGLPTSRAMPLVATRMAFTVAVHGVVQPVFWGAIALLGQPIPSQYAILVALILLLENLASDSHGPLIARGRVLLASFNLFLRTGLWPITIIAIGLVYPPARSLTWILAAWVAGLSVMMLVLAFTALRDGRWRWLGLQWNWLRDALRQSWPLYLTRLGTVGSLYADRFIISYFLGLELTGVYVFFWSAANVVHSITVYGTMQPRVPALVTAAESDGVHGMRKRLTQYQIETMGWAVLLFAMLWIAIGMFVQVADKPQLDAHTAIFLWIILAMLLRILADSFHFALFALRRDRITVTINLAGAAGSALLNALLVPTLGLAGAVIASLLTAAGLLFSRFLFSRPLNRDDASDRPGAGPAQAGLPAGRPLTPGLN